MKKYAPIHAHLSLGKGSKRVVMLVASMLLSSFFSRMHAAPPTSDAKKDALTFLDLNNWCSFSAAYSTVEATLEIPASTCTNAQRKKCIVQTSRLIAPFQ